MNALPNALHHLPPRLLAGLLALHLAFVPVYSFAASGSKSSDGSVSPRTGDASEASGDYPKLVVGPGDILSIFVYGENSSMGGGSGVSGLLPTDYEVDSDGVILFPFLGKVKLSGLTPVEAGEKIAGLLSKPRKVTVLIKQSDAFWVSVLGNVAKPGRYQILGRPTLMSALAEAGGPLPDSDLGGTILLHNAVKRRVDLNDYFQGEGKVRNEPYLYPGDTLMVQRNPWPSLGEIAIVASILASAAVVSVELSSLHH